MHLINHSKIVTCQTPSLHLDYRAINYIRVENMKDKAV